MATTYTKRFRALNQHKTAKRFGTSHFENVFDQKSGFFKFYSNFQLGCFWDQDHDVGTTVSNFSESSTRNEWLFA